MKKKSLLILLATILTHLSAFSVNTAEKKMAIEGRTWWYKCQSYRYPCEQEFGIRIGEEVTIDGEKWNKVKLYMYDEPHHPDSTSAIKADTATIGYIKDDGRTVSSQAVYSPEYCESLSDSWFFQDKNIVNSIYTFGEIDSEGFYGSNDNIFGIQSYTIKNISEVINSGNSYREFHCVSDQRGLLYDTYEYIEGIGHPEFFMLLPYHVEFACFPKWGDPELAYVTDGDDNHVIYEAAGCKKIWELAGVEAVTVDSDNSQPEWYTLQGVKIDEPTAPGVYVRRTGSRTEKVAVK